MEKVFSSSDPGMLLHVIIDTAAVSSERVDLSPPEEFLQISVVPLAAGRALKPHRALPRSVGGEGPVQEAWIVVRGSIEVGLYDVDRAFLKSAILQAGWILLTFRGGHSFTTVDDQTTLIECKLGPYIGRDYEFL
jgi:hypothetical protein